jgi:hypothetical protein
MNATTIFTRRNAADRGRRQSATEPGVRELDHRTSDGIDVWLLWNTETERVSIAVEDHRLGQSLAFEVAAAEAIAAFQHPFAYAALTMV